MMKSDRVTEIGNKIKELLAENGSTATFKMADDMQPHVEEAASAENDTLPDSHPAVPAEDAESELSRMHAWEKRLLKQRGVVSMAQTQVDILTEKLKDARKNLEHETAMLLGIIDESTQPTLFADPAVDGKPDETTLQAEFDAASGYSIGIKAVLIDKLEADGIHNGKELRTWFNEHPRRKIAGVGEGTCEKIQEIMAAWWDGKQNKPADAKA